MTLPEIAEALKAEKAKIVLAYAFNATGKTQLSVAYKNVTKTEDGSHVGVYYNAYSEDLFVWDNDEENGGGGIRLSVGWSSLSRFHASITEDNIRDKLRPYTPTYGFVLNYHEDVERGIESVSFFVPNQNADETPVPIKISRGEERIFVWCLYLALFEVDAWTGAQSSHFFIDDPVSSLDDHNIFVTAYTLYDLIDAHFENRKIIVTTHHMGLFSILSDLLLRGEKSERFKKHVKGYILSGKTGQLSLETPKTDVMLYHLRLLQILDKAQEDNDVRAYHFALLRQVLENVASFLGIGQFGYVLQQLGFDDTAEVANIVNTLSHKKVYYYETDLLVPDNRKVFDDVLNRLKDKYKFRLHAA